MTYFRQTRAIALTNIVRKLCSALMIALLCGCANGPQINTNYRAVSQDSRAQFLILHFTALDFPRSLEVLTKGDVSSHYLIDENPPTIYRLVDEDRRAYHAGLSYWKGQTQLNASSIGIEIVNLGYRDTPDGRVWFDYPEAQIESVIALVQSIVARHQIRGERIMAHSDIAPQRKSDPGPRFPWQRLAKAGLIPWPDANAVALRKTDFEQQLPDAVWFQRKLEQHGYAVPLTGILDIETISVIRAFQMKYRPSRCDGVPDAESAAMLDVLTSSADPPRKPI